MSLIHNLLPNAHFHTRSSLDVYEGFLKKRHTMQIHIQKAEKSRLEAFNFENFSFGTETTDHILTAKYAQNRWLEAKIEPYREISLSPLAMCFHYGQTVFEGLKAYKQPSGAINIFRLDKHAERMNKSLRRMCMPEVPQELFIEGIKQLVSLEKNWISDKEGYSLYLRPFMIATENRLGLVPSQEYLFMVVATPMTSYYSKPLKVKVEREYVRAAEGGAGAAKNGGNYGAAFYPTIQANKQGYDQILWTDAQNHNYFEESGTMNLIFIVDGTLLTPPAGSTVLEGVTRDSVLQIARHIGIPVEERPISITEIQNYFESGSKIEAFGVGTAAIVAPFSQIDIDTKSYVPYFQEDAQMFVLKTHLQNIRLGVSQDIWGWNTLI